MSHHTYATGGVLDGLGLRPEDVEQPRLTPERREEIAALFHSSWNAVLLTYCVGDRDLMDAWRLAWQKLGFEIPEEMRLQEVGFRGVAGDMLEFFVRRQEMGASMRISRTMLKDARFPQHMLTSVSESLENALRCRSGEPPVVGPGGS